MLVSAENKAEEIRRQAAVDADGRIRRAEKTAAALLARVDTLPDTEQVQALRRELDALREASPSLETPTSVLPPLESEPLAQPRRSTPDEHEIEYEELEPEPEGESETGEGDAPAQRPGVVKRLLGKRRERPARQQATKAAGVVEPPEGWRDSAGGEMECMICRRAFSDAEARMAQCCRPEPGDAIVGYLAPDGTIAVHREDCPRVEDLAEYRWSQ